MKEQKLIKNIFLTVFVLLFLTNIFFLVIAFSINNSIWLEIILAVIFALLETIIIVVLLTYYNDVLKVVGKNSGRIIRLENLNHPLLQKLSNAAPGTYNHSLNVAQLATKAAKSAGIDPGYLRIGAYFHDIGKLKNPKIFIENQKSPSEISRQDLKKISHSIIDHVLYGQKLAREYNLPDEVIEYISQHHGSSEIYSLKEKLLRENLNAQYPGPKPLSKEAAILMLADSIEARIRSMKSISDENINKAIETEFAQKINDGQIDLSGLSSQELSLAKKSFIRTISAIYHNRKARG